MMKKLCIVFFLILFYSVNTFAQSKKESREKIKTLKIAYITEQLNLTQKEAEKFWPVYNLHEDKIDKVFRKKMHDIKQEIYAAGTIDNIADKRAEAIFEMMQQIEKNKNEENERYLTELKKILSVKKILKLQISERDFGRKLMQKYRKKGTDDKE